MHVSYMNLKITFATQVASMFNAILCSKQLVMGSLLLETGIGALPDEIMYMHVFL